jgi:ActR/RegA family two-component response regulator
MRMNAALESPISSPAILLADPSPSITAALSEQLRNLGFEQLWMARTVAEARDVIALARPDLIISELHFDDGTGFDLLRTAATSTASIRFAAVSSYASIPASVHLLHLGAAACLSKPTTAAEILGALGVPPARAPAPREHHLPLDRAIWTFLIDVLSEAKSFSEAARRLDLDRTSLRRMLFRRASAGSVGRTSS